MPRIDIHFLAKKPGSVSFEPGVFRCNIHEAGDWLIGIAKTGIPFMVLGVVELDKPMSVEERKLVEMAYPPIREVRNEVRLPESLRKKPNIPHRDQSIPQLIEERNYWQWRINTASGPASAGASMEFRDECIRELSRRGVKL